MDVDPDLHQGSYHGELGLHSAVSFPAADVLHFCHYGTSVKRKEYQNRHKRRISRDNEKEIEALKKKLGEMRLLTSPVCGIKSSAYGSKKHPFDIHCGRVSTILSMKTCPHPLQMISPVENCTSILGQGSLQKGHTRRTAKSPGLSGLSSGVAPLLSA